MKIIAVISIRIGTLALMLVAFAFFIIKPVLAQVQATSTEAVATSTEMINEIVTPDEAATPIVEPPVATASSVADSPPARERPSGDETTTAPVVAESQSVEVQLNCSMSYTGILYDTPSGHLDDGYFIGEAVASTTGMTAAHEIGEQSWTKCHDDEGVEYEYKLTPEEYAALAVRGTPQKSVMKSSTASVLRTSADAPSDTAISTADQSAPASPEPETATPADTASSTPAAPATSTGPTST